ncbi:WD40 repeat domain-containing protein [Methylocaldum sp. MU1018]
MKAILSFIQKLFFGLFVFGLGVLVLIALIRSRDDEGGDRDVWKRAKALNTLEGYLDYLRNCPSCPHEADAEKAVDQFQRPRGLLARLEHTHVPSHAAIVLPVFSPAGPEILGAAGTSLDFWDSTTGQQILRGKSSFRIRGGRHLESLAYSPDGLRIAAGMSGSEGGYLLLWDRKNGELLADYALEGYDIKAVAFSPDGAAVGWIAHGPTGIWEPASGKFLRATHEGSSALAFIRRDDGKSLLVTASGREIWFWDAASMEIVKQAEFNTDRSLLGLSQDGFLVAFYEGPVLELWDTRLGTLIATLPEHDGEITAFCRDRRKGWIAVGTKSGSLYLWDLAEAKKLGSVPAHEGPVEQVACSAQGRVATVGWDATKVWDLEKLRYSSRQKPY